MAYIQVEASVRTHRKFLEAGPAASWLWLCGIGYCQDGLTDGFIPKKALDFLGVPKPSGLARRLVDAGLWEVTDGGWHVHDYAHHNRSSDDVREMMRDISAVRRAAGAAGGRASGISRRSKIAEANEANNEANEASVEAGIKQTAKQPEALPSYRPTDLPSDLPGESARANGNEAKLRGPLHDTSHRKHAECGRICLHGSQFNEFVRRRNHPDADREVRDWAHGILKEWAEKPEEPGDPFDFWRARYDERWPSPQAQVTNARRPAWVP